MIYVLLVGQYGPLYSQLHPALGFYLPKARCLNRRFPIYAKYPFALKTASLKTAHQKPQFKEL